MSIALPVARLLLESSEGSEGRYINEKGGGQTITKSSKCFKEKYVIRKIFSYIPLYLRTIIKKTVSRKVGLSV